MALPPESNMLWIASRWPLSTVSWALGEGSSSPLLQRITVSGLHETLSLLWLSRTFPQGPAYPGFHRGPTEREKACGILCLRDSSDLTENSEGTLVDSLNNCVVPDCAPGPCLGLLAEPRQVEGRGQIPQAGLSPGEMHFEDQGCFSWVITKTDDNVQESLPAPV